MAKAKKAKELKIVSQVELENGTVLVQYEDGSYAILVKVSIPAETAESFFGSESSEEDEEDEEEEKPLTAESLQEMDFEELEDVCDDKELDTDPDDYDEDDVDKLRADIAKELGIKLPKAKAKGKGKKGKK
nr:MAG TPA: hypothetical protein [Caudoviricetes sp.]